jgi:hypothetical protein
MHLRIFSIQTNDVIILKLLSIKFSTQKTVKSHLGEYVGLP